MISKALITTNGQIIIYVDADYVARYRILGIVCKRKLSRYVDCRKRSQFSYVAIISFRKEIIQENIHECPKIIEICEHFLLQMIPDIQYVTC